MSSLYRIFIIGSFFYFNSSCYAIIDIHQEAVHRDTSDLRLAQNLADNILHINKGNGLQLDIAIDRTIMRDHTENHHLANASYFRTNDRNAIKNLILFVVREADRFDPIYERNGRYRFTLRKTISQADAQRLFGKNNIGYEGDEIRGTGEYRNHVILCFDVTGVETLEDSLGSNNRMGFMTAFPGRENQVCN